MRLRIPNTWQRLRAGEERYRSLFHSSPVPMWVFDIGTLRFLAVNEAAVHCYGYSRADFSSMKVTDILVDTDANKKLLVRVIEP